MREYPYAWQEARQIIFPSVVGDASFDNLLYYFLVVVKKFVWRGQEGVRNVESVSSLFLNHPHLCPLVSSLDFIFLHLWQQNADSVSATGLSNLWVLFMAAMKPFQAFCLSGPGSFLYRIWVYLHFNDRLGFLDDSGPKCRLIQNISSPVHYY